jgi:hypothetical protein
MLPRKRSDILLLEIIDSSSDRVSLTHATQTHMEGDQDTLDPDTGTYMGSGLLTCTLRPFFTLVQLTELLVFPFTL